ncbi:MULTISPECIES: ABC transporter permease [unclassified Rhizobium]|uniref:ABC transporter permease n=1 Tax=unclassified Rhizobium TaxID=2613769 RepID=UPI0016121F07|nr:MULTISPECIES: ABC transporter permease [unclassified Rhizobium]MBB3384087.1 putative ABC transport system permease protein [Rhizobium sp. BK098]MBB3615787.1 putative ABC transport system permease protein [Rhizobium sp. BK609]MBB3681446.1 putative ABC transport system permease protein [Rhizobium sp. BK612]
MSIQIRQIIVATRTTLGSMKRRLAISLSMALSVSLVVVVLIGFLATASGFEKALSGAGSPLVAVVLGGGTNQETGSDISADAIRNLKASGDDIGVLRDSAGNLVVSRELVIPVDVTSKGSSRTLALRGMDGSGLSIRNGIALSQGRLFAPGAREIVVGAGIARDYPGFSLGAKVRLGTVDWTVVGHFTANGSAFESEIWGDIDAAHAAFDRQGEVQSLRLPLVNPSSLAKLNARLATITETPLTAVSEAGLYASQAGCMADLIRLFGWPIALLMAIGATAGALNTMMSSISDRTVEIATMRALGFSRLSAFLATWLEAALLAAAGAAVGVLASRLVFEGWRASTIGANDASMAFQLTVTPQVMLTGGMLGLSIGLLGGALPALAASRLPLIAALRARG